MSASLLFYIKLIHARELPTSFRFIQTCGLLFALFTISSPLHAQHKVTFIVHDLSEIKRDTILIAGTFNNWENSRNPAYFLKGKTGSTKSIELTLPSGLYEYKYSGGTWLSAEKDFLGIERPNRLVRINKDTIIQDTVSEWRDLLMQSKHQALDKAKHDTSRLVVLSALANIYGFNFDYYNVDSAFYYISASLKTLDRIKASPTLHSWPGYYDRMASIFRTNANLLISLGNYTKALELQMEIIKLAELEDDPYKLLAANFRMADIFLRMKDFTGALAQGRKIASMLKGIRSKAEYHETYLANVYHQLAICHYNLNNPDSSLYYVRFMYQMGLKKLWYNDIAQSTLLMADNFAAQHKIDSAFYYYNYSIGNASIVYAIHLIHLALKGKAELFQMEEKLDSALFYAKEAFDLINKDPSSIQVWGENADSYLQDISPLLAELYKDNHQIDSAYKYLSLSVSLKDSLYSTDKVRQFQSLTFNEAMRVQQVEQKNKEEQQRYQTRVKMYGLILGIAGLFTLAIVLYRNNKSKQTANALLESQKRDIERTLGELQTTQKQLIQSEKMASLGELTAGIAHEIQNPLNFVNNFSEVNTELIDEMNHEIDKGNLTEVKSIAKDIKENQKKITDHGKRADAIVKGMLQHSRSSSGIKEPTDINALADEYLRLAYHGLRAKDKSFNATMITDYDPSIGLVNVIPQDIGRVILNLITNAFYAVSDKAKMTSQTPYPLEGGVDFEPLVSVSTKLQVPLSGGRGSDGAMVTISVSDNGPGIPASALDKIFQPFFTTKPTGKGTGLGLSLSYDIIKAHGGEIRVNTKEGEGTEFIILLPVT
jgi:two-component system NtrC family sensor kinase